MIPHTAAVWEWSCRRTLFFAATRRFAPSCPQKPHVIYLSPQGKVLTQQMAVEYSKEEYLFLLCGHYEGVDERVLEEIVDEELSIGDYVLTGGELPALVVVRLR